MHNHNTCTDGSVSAGYAIDRSVATGVAPAGGNNFDLDWFTLGNHGGSGNRDCRFSDTSANIPGDTTTTWDQTLGKTIERHRRQRNDVAMAVYQADRISDHRQPYADV